MIYLLIFVVNLMYIAALIVTVVNLRALGRSRDTQMSGTWYGAGEPPEGFRGYWFDGRVHQVYPLEIGTTDMTAEEIADSEID